MKRLIALMSTVGLMAIMFSAPASADANKVWVCKVVGGPGNYSLETGKNPIEVSENALNQEYPGIGDQFSDAQPSYLVKSEDAKCKLPEDGTQVDKKVWVCKIVGGPGNYSVKEGKNPIEVSENALNQQYPGIGNQFSDAQPSYLVESEHAVCAVPPVDRDVSVTAPAFTAGSCSGPGSVVATETNRYSWTTTGPEMARVYKAAAKADFKLTGQTSWTFDVRQLSGSVCSSVVQNTPVTAVTAPILTAGTCLASGKVTAPETVAYSWTTTGPDNAKVYTAVAKAGFTLTGTTSWTFDLRQLPTQKVNPRGACYLAPAAPEPVQVLGVSETAQGVAGTAQGVAGTAKAAAGAPKSLAFTGAADVLPLGIVGLFALALGGVLTTVGRRWARS